MLGVIPVQDESSLCSVEEGGRCVITIEKTKCPKFWEYRFLSVISRDLSLYMLTISLAGPIADVNKVNRTTVTKRIPTINQVTVLFRCETC